MPRSHKGHRFILCIIDGVTNYLITVPIHQAKSEVGKALIENVITKYCVPEYIIMDQDSTFMFSFMTCAASHSTLYPSLHKKKQRIQVGNGQFVSVLFIIPVIVDIHGHRFEIHTLVSEIHENIDLVLGIKNVFELEGVINAQDCCFNFLNRPLPIFPRECIVLKPKEQKLIKVKAPFIDEISSYQNITWKHLQYHAVKIKIHVQCNNIRCSQ